MRNSICSAVFAGIVLLVAGCHDLTEYEGSLSADVIFISTSDHSVVGSIDGITDGRALCSIDNNTFYVLSGSGTLHEIDSEAMEIDTSFSVFSGSGGGIYDLVSPPPRAKLYVLGSGNEIVEVNIGTNTVTDVFQAGPSPCCMAASRQSTNVVLYLADSNDGRFREVDITDNRVLRWIQLPFTPQTIEPGKNGDFVMVSSRSDGSIGLVSLVTPGMGFSYTHFECPSPAYDIQVTGDSSSYFITCPDWSGTYGTALVSDSLGDLIGNLGSIQGHPFTLSSTPIGHYLYVLSNTGGGSCEITVIDIFFGGTVAQIPIQGYPWDMVSHRNGEYILVLVGQ